MKTALKKIFTFFVNLFKSKDMKSEIYTILLGNLNAPELKELQDADIMNKAWEFVKELHVRTDLTGSEKAKLFNEKLGYWGKKVGKVIGTMALNIVRFLQMDVESRHTCARADLSISRTTFLV